MTDSHCQTPPLLERTVRYAIQHKEAEESLRLSSQRLRALSARQRSVVEQERQRVAREMHDALGHNLTVVRLGLTWLLKRFSRLAELAPEAQIADKIESLSAVIDSTIQSVRKLTTELRPGVLDTSGLIAAIEWQAQEFEKQTGIMCESALPAESNEQMSPAMLFDRQWALLLLETVLGKLEAEFAGSTNVGENKI